MHNLGGFSLVVLFLGTSGACLTFFLLALMGKGNISTQRALLFAFPALGVVTILLLVVPLPFSGSIAVLICLNFICGMVIGWLYLVWGSFYKKLETKSAIVVLFGSTIIAAIMKIVVSVLVPGIPAAFVCALLPVLSVLCWCRADRDVRESPVSPVRFTADKLYVFKSMAAAVVVFSFALGIMRMLDLGYFSQPFLFEVLSHVLVMVVSAAFVLMIYHNREDLEFSHMWFIVLLVIATGLLFAELFDGSLSSLAFAILSVAQMFVVSLMWLALSDVAHNSPYCSDRVFGIGWPLYSFPVALGSCCTLLLDLGFVHSSLSLVVVYGLLIATFLFMARRIPRQLRLLADLNPPLTGDGLGHLADRLDVLAETYRLSKREKEVVFLYAQGRNRAYVSSEMFISENTVRDHIRSVYKKIGIHDKQELIDRLHG